MNKQTLIESIKENLIEMDEDKVVELCEQSLQMKIPPLETINEGLIKGMDEVSKLYEEEEYFLPEILMCADAMNSGLEVVQPHLDKNTMTQPLRVVIGVVEGDTHDIGKNLVRILMEASGMEVHDLGRDVPLESFVTKAVEIKADVIVMSTLMSTTMDGMKKVITMLEEKNIRNQFKVFIGGGPISQFYADKIGADVYTNDASEAVRMAKQIALETLNRNKREVN
ncbi:corrinoid protein [Fusibacter sp. JL216-2]|uniref:corrinoid protein n=1 Tax=Fusibacter sp. JL216-2 TaxID=3071453 RepID=UPI003D34F372